MCADSMISWLPAWVPETMIEAYQVRPPSPSTASFGGLRPRLECWPQVAEGLRRAQRAVRAIPVADIVAAIDAAAARWVDPSYPPRGLACADVVAATGLSAQVVGKAFDTELRHYRADELYRALRRELGDPAVLDGFRPDRNLAGCTVAFGPEITLEVFAGNVPGLPARSLVRALLAKSAVIAKVSGHEPTFTAHFVATLAEIMPALAEAIVVTYWDRTDEPRLQRVAEQADTVIVYGSDEACARIRDQVGMHQRFVAHAHRVSVGILATHFVDHIGPAETATRVAADFSMFNQHACLSPQFYLVEGGFAGVQKFAMSLADAMSAYAADNPLGALDCEDALALQHLRLTKAWQVGAAAGHELLHDSGLDWTVTVEPDLDRVRHLGHRVATIVPVANLERAVELLRPLSRRLQTVGLGALGDRFGGTARALANIGACRITEPGRMTDASFVWRHDGALRICELLRWCDVEQHREAYSVS